MIKFEKRKLGNGYIFLDNPMINGAPKIEPEELHEFVKLTGKSFTDFNLIVTPEEMGLLFATALAMETNIPISLVRKHPLSLKFEHKLSRSTGYKQDCLFINLPTDQPYKVLFVDDVLSTGGTARAILNHLRAHMVDIVGASIFLNKKDFGGQKIIEEEFNLPLQYLYIFSNGEIKKQISKK